MKRYVLILTTLLAAAILTGCNRGDESRDAEEQVLRVCVNDSPQGTFYKAVEDAGNKYREKHPEIKFQIEWISEEPENEAKIKKLKTDIMSGKGPDLFVLQSIGQNTEEAAYLFPNVNKAMESGVFCKLDNYMKEDNFQKEVNVRKEILEAGTYNGRQYVLPITIDFLMLVQNKEEKLDISETKNFMDCMRTANEIGNHQALAGLNSLYTTSYTFLMERMLDYEKQEVLFDKEKYVELAEVATDVVPQEQSGEAPRSGIGFFTTTTFAEDNLDYQIVPTAMGERLAYVSSYGAINVNTKQKETAYKFLHFIVNNEWQNGTKSAGGNYSGIMTGADFPVNRDGFEAYMEGAPSKESVLSCYDSIENCVFLSETSKWVGDKIREVNSRRIGGEKPYTERDLEVAAEEIYKKCEMILKE